MVTEESIKQALKAVKYPGFSRDIISFGLLKKAEYREGTVEIALDLSKAKPEAVRQYTNTKITLVRYSSDIEQYVRNAFYPGHTDDLKEVIYFKEMDQINVFVKPERLGLFLGKGGANVATVSKLVGKQVYVYPAG